MGNPGDLSKEIESFNLADLDVSAMDSRLEMTTLIPQCTLIICGGNCGVNCFANTRGGCNCDVYN
jgi:uncharacterized Fe-S radical SAM superfamily protein PflX